MAEVVIGLCSLCGGAVVWQDKTTGRPRCRDCKAIMREVRGPVVPMEPTRQLLNEDHEKNA